MKPQQAFGFQPVRTIISNSNSHNNVSLTTTEPITKKESRLKHFFSPIRKKPIIAPNPPTMSQPDVFVSNILPSNMYVNPLHLQNYQNKPDSALDIDASISPTSSFQVEP